MHFSGTQVHLDGSKDLEWYDGDGRPMTMERWADERIRTCLLYTSRCV